MPDPCDPTGMPADLSGESYYPTVEHKPGGTRPRVGWVGIPHDQIPSPTQIRRQAETNLRGPKDCICVVINEQMDEMQNCIAK